MRIVALDPGKTTGAALATLRNDDYEIETVCQVEPDFIWRTLTNYKPEVIVMERFIGYPKIKMDFSPVEVIGIVKEWCRQNDVTLVEQTPAQAKHYFTDARLKERNVYVKGMPHGCDAIRHLLYWLDFGRKAPTHPVLNQGSHKKI